MNVLKAKTIKQINKGTRVWWHVAKKLT